MKIFVFSVLLFALIVTGIILNYNYVNETSDTLCDLARGLPEAASPDCGERTSALDAEWEARRTVIGFSSGVDKLKTIDDCLDALRVYAKAEVVSEFERERELLINAIEELSEFESFSFKNLF